MTILFLGLLSGCSLFKPEHPKTPIDIPDQWTTSTTQHAQVLSELAWWQPLGSSQLNSLLESALQQNNDLHLASANLHYAQAQLKQVQLNWIPGMNLMAGYSAMPYLGDPGYFFGLFPTYVLNVFQQLDSEKSATYQVKASQYARDSVRLTVIGQVSGSYFTLLAQEESLKLYEKLLRDNNKLLALYQSQYRAGIISSDVLEQCLSEIKKIKAQIAIVQHNIISSKNALHYLLNQNPGDLKLTASFNELRSDAIIPGNLPLAVIKNRPDLKEAEALLKAADANVAVASSNLLPSVKLDNLMMQSSTADGYVNLNEAYINIPVAAPTVLGQISASQAKSQAAYTQYVSKVRAALRDIENNFSGYSAYRQQLTNHQEAFEAEKQECHLSQVRYRYGIDSALELVQCQIKLDTFLLMLNQDKLEKMMALAALYQSLGGGYDVGKKHHDV